MPKSTLIVLVSLTLLGIDACDLRRPEPKPRPANVPLEATWQSGKEWGYFFYCTTDASSKSNHCRLYNFRGRLVTDGQFILRGSNRAAFSEELQYEFYDHKSIFLADHKFLDPVVSSESLR
jgi:hypothetical protein